MKKFKVKFISIILSVVMLFGLVAVSACTDKEKEDNTTTYRVFFLENVEQSDLQNVTNMPAPQNVSGGSFATQPTENPERTGYTFSGWFADEACATPFEFATTPINSVTNVYDGWSENITYYTVTLNLNYDGSANAEQKQVASGSTVQVQDPEREGFVFLGWSTQAGSMYAYDFENEVTADFTLYAMWDEAKTITYDFNYAGSTSQKVVYGVSQTIEELLPERENYVFGGWFTEAACENDYPFGKLTQDVTVYAKWNTPGQGNFTVTFDYNYAGSQNTTATVRENALAREDLSARPVREGYAFSGWYTDAECTLAYRNNTPVTADITLYAGWSEGYLIRFDLNYEGAPTAEPTLVAVGESIAKPADPVRSATDAYPDYGYGYEFLGWSTSSDSSAMFEDFGQEVTENLTLYAQWKHTYLFGACYTDLDELEGSGYSGGASGTDMIIKDSEFAMAEAESGYFISYLYITGITLTFEITSDRDAEVEFIVRLSGEGPSGVTSITLTDDQYAIKVNDDKVTYGSVTFDNILGIQDEQKRPFTDCISVKANLKKGVNTIALVTSNSETLGGTLNATAPIVDCIKITTDAVLTWSPKLSNVVGK